jgi:hypothetical protein
MLSLHKQLITLLSKKQYFAQFFMPRNIQRNGTPGAVPGGKTMQLS